jgi:hypothetical protein
MNNQFAVTEFPSSRETIPSAEHVGLDWKGVEGIYAGNLVITTDKAEVSYVLPCLLKEAEFVGKTAERMAKRGLFVGKQRSANHVTVARVLVFDFDGLNRAQLNGIAARLNSLMYLCLVYSSYSHGNPQKPGAHIRVVICLDREVNAAEYTTLWLVINDQMFDGLADPSSRHMYQQQGVWATRPDRRDKAFKRIAGAIPLPCDRWLPENSVIQSKAEQVATAATSEQIRRTKQAIRWVDTSDYEQWIKVGSALKAMDENAFEQDWLSVSEPSNDLRYNPEAVWNSLRPNMPAEAGYRTILAIARDGATAAVEKCRGLEKFTPEGEAAAMYLNQYHKRHWADLNGGQ